MDKYIEVIKKSIQLSDTILEGLEHITKLLNDGKHEQSVFLFEDVMEAYTSIRTATEPIVKKLKSETVREKQVDIENVIVQVVSEYEKNNYLKVQEIFQHELVPKYKTFKEELEKLFEPYLIS